MLLAMLFASTIGMAEQSGNSQDQQQVDQSPVQQTPVTQGPVQQEPEVQTPVQQEPEVQTPVQQEPEVQTPVQQEPEVLTPVQQEPEVQTPVQQEPEVQTPVQQEPEVQTPVQQEPTDSGEQNQQSGYDDDVTYNCEVANLDLLAITTENYDLGLIAFRHSDRRSAESIFEKVRQNLISLLRNKDCVDAATHDRAFRLYVSTKQKLRVIDQNNW